MRAELRRSIVLACAGLLAGFALVVTLYAAGTLFKRGLGSPTGLEAPTGIEAPAGLGVPDGAAPPPAAPNVPAAPGNRPGEGAGPAGKPRAALEARPGPDHGPTVPTDSEAPSFDIIRIEPNGEAVIAGRAAPNTTVELLRDSVPIARALVDPSGQFAIVPPALPAGSSEITLRVAGADGQVRLSRDSVAVMVAPGRDTKPLIALTSPDRPTIVLSQPDPVTAGTGPVRPDGDRLATNMPADAARTGPRPSQAGQAGSPGPRGGTKPAVAAAAEKAAPVKIVSVEAEEGGKLYVTSRAQPGATVRLYLNDTLVAPGSAGTDGRVAFTIGRGVLPGDYRIRVDQVDSVSGKVKARSEVAFAVPATVIKPPAKGQSDASGEATTTAPTRSAARARVGTPENPASLPPAAAPPEAGTARAGLAATGAAMALPGTPPDAASERLPASTEASPTVFVPEIGTARIIRGDSLWQISRRIYGKGTRYTVIFDANQPQIRNPDLIYPGQIFVVPPEGPASQDGTRG